jgi:hypothetical protein
VSGESISLRSAVDFVRVTYIKDKEILMFNFIFDILWTGRVFIDKFRSFLSVP